MTTILIGCDPEVFVRKGNNFLSAYGLIKGDKANPQKVRNGAVQVDGMALEFNIDPARTEDEFCINVQDVFAQMKLMVPQYSVEVVPVAHFDPDYMAQQPAEALALGCDPDFNAWKNGTMNIKPDGDRPFRTASGHVHIGWDDGQNLQDPGHLSRCQMVIKQMDLFLGIPSLFYDADKKRREMYGKAGCFRPKSYGVEYRTLSNAWLKSETLMRWVYRNAVKAMQQCLDGNFLYEKYPNIEEIINSSNLKEAKKIVADAQLEVCHG